LTDKDGVRADSSDGAAEVAAVVASVGLDVHCADASAVTSNKLAAAITRRRLMTFYPLRNQPHPSRY
jgi:hypothetical protein